MNGPAKDDPSRRSARSTAAAAALLLGADPAQAKAATASSDDRGLTDLIELVTRVLGVERPSGDHTLTRIDNRDLCELLEEHVQLGLGTLSDAVIDRLCVSTLVVAGCDPRGQRRLSIEEVQRDGRRLLCAFTDRAALQASPSGRVECAWALPAHRVAEFALSMGYGGCVINPGSLQEVVLGAAVLHRVRTRVAPGGAA